MKFPRSSDEAREFVVGERPTFIIQARDWAVLVHDMPMPYVPDPNKAADSINELRVQTAMREHKAWLSVDVIQNPEAATNSEKYCRIGRVLAEFADDECLAIYAPEVGGFVQYGPGSIAALRSDDPLRHLPDDSEPPVIQIDGDDPRMRAAVAEARTRLPEFVRAFEAGAGGKHYSIKAPITSSGETEFIWVEVTNIERGEFVGRLANEPVALKGLRAGDVVRVAIDDLNDWIYVKDGEMIGGFTVRVLDTAQGRNRGKRHER